jgi:hypothetical protein
MDPCTSFATTRCCKEVGAQMPSRYTRCDPSKPEHDPAVIKKLTASKE